MTITDVRTPTRVELSLLNKLLIVVHQARPVFNHGGNLTACDVMLTVVTGPESPRQLVGRIYDAHLTPQIMSGVRKGRVERDGFYWVLDEPWDEELSTIDRYLHAA